MRVPSFRTAFLSLLLLSLPAVAPEEENVCQAEFVAYRTCLDTVGEDDADVVSCTSCASVVIEVNVENNANCGRATKRICNGINECSCNATACGDEIKTFHKCEAAAALQLFGCPSKCGASLGASAGAFAVVVAAAAGILALM